MTTLIYTRRNLPGEAWDLFCAARERDEAPRLRTERYYDGPEAADLVYTDDEAIRADYEEAGAEVRPLDYEHVDTFTDDDWDDGSTYD